VSLLKSEPPGPSRLLAGSGGSRSV
jgi:hypothetical protein